MDLMQFLCAWRRFERRVLGLRTVGAAWLLGVAAFAPVPAAAQPAEAPLHYRAVAARHVYETYAQRIYRGQLPPLLHAIAITETEVDENGHVVSAVVTREPASAKDVGPRIVSMIHAASPFPKPAQAGRTRFSEVWLVDKSGAFQLDALTEGQR